MSNLQGENKGAILTALRQLQVTDKAHADVFNPLFQALLDNDVTLEAVAKAYTDAQVQLVTETGIPKLVSYKFLLKAEFDLQVEFTIPLANFNKETDTCIVAQNSAILNDIADYSIVGEKVVLNNPVDAGTEIFVIVFKNVPIGPEGSVSGKVIGAGTLDESKFSEELQEKINSTETHLQPGEREKWDKAAIDATIALQTKKTNKDANGIYTSVGKYRKSTGTLYQLSVLSGGTSPLYTTRTVTNYAEDGITEIAKNIYTLTYDADGQLISEE